MDSRNARRLGLFHGGIPSLFSKQPLTRDGHPCCPQSLIYATGRMPLLLACGVRCRSYPEPGTCYIVGQQVIPSLRRQHWTHPRSSTKRAIQHRSLRRNSLLPSSEFGSTSWNPSIVRASFGSIQSAREILLGGSTLWASIGTRLLCNPRSSDIVVAIDTYQHVSSSALCFPGNIHGTLIMKAKTISTERQRVDITRLARDLQWLESRRDRAPAEGMNSADMAAIEVKRNADRDRVKEGV